VQLARDAPPFLILQVQQLARKETQTLFCPFPLGNVTDGTRNQRALVRLQRTEANLHWKFLTIPVQTK
jgi:hypothetical protein